MSDLQVEALPGMQPVEVAHGAGTVVLILPATGPHAPAVTALLPARAQELGELLIRQAGYAEQALRGASDDGD